MRVTFSRLFRAIVLLLVLTMVGHVAGASAHGALCQESQHAEHGHSSGPANGHDHGGHDHGGAPDVEIQAAHDHGDGSQNHDQKRPQAALAQCHGMVGGCLGCSVASTVELPTPETSRQAVITPVETFSPIDPGVEHRPPIVLL